MGVCNCSLFCCTLLYVHSSIAIILMWKRELIAMLNLSSWCLMMVERLFLAVPRGCLQFVIVVFPDHTHLQFLNFVSEHGSHYAQIWLKGVDMKKNPPLFYLACLRSFGALSGWAYPQYILCDLFMIWNIAVVILVTMNERQRVLSL